MHNHTYISRLVAGLFFTLLTLSHAFADGPPNGRWNVNADNVVLDGNDVVAYQNQDRAVHGDARHFAVYQGGRFLFASAKNRDLFIAKPDKYTPKYGGFCAFAMGNAGQKAPADPATFKMYNGELLVFFNNLYQGKKFNTKVPWNANEQSLHAKAEQNWRQYR